MSIKCFLIQPTGRTILSARRYGGNWTDCPVHGYHTAAIEMERVDGIVAGDIVTDEHKNALPFPKTCDCGYVFKDEDNWQIFSESEYKTDSGGLTTIRDSKPGAIWRATWYEDDGMDCGTDGRAYVCKTPDGDWHIDGRASNCDSPCKHCGAAYNAHDKNVCQNYEDAKPHKCWVRHGEAPNFTIDKNGVTCGAGAGSIQQKTFHGFLRNGELITC